MSQSRSRVSIAGWAFAAVSIMLFVWGLWIEPRQLIIHRASLDVPHWPEPLRGFRLALMSDLHIGSPHWSLGRLEALVEQTNREQPDVVLLAGDYLIDGVWLGTWVAPEAIARALGGLRAPHGTVAVLGNHDWSNDGERVRRAFRDQGIVVLENEAHAVTRGLERFHIVGLADALLRKVDLASSIAQVPTGEPFLVLAHEPDVFPEIDARASLTLTGHTHGGQVRLPLLGRLIVPSKYGERYAAGHVVEEGRHLFVTTGLGTSIIPVRLAVPPELVVLELR